MGGLAATMGKSKREAKSESESEESSEEEEKQAKVAEESSEDSSSEEEEEAKPSPKKKPKTVPSADQPQEGCKLFVGSLSWDTDEAGLKAFFEDCGEIEEVFLPTDRETGYKRGFG